MPFVPITFDIPQTLETTSFRLRMLTVNDVVKDYDAVMSSAAHLTTLFEGGTWPTDLTLEQNLIDLGWHQKEFQTRRSFAYTVVTPAQSRVLGCVYINPTRKLGFDAEAYLWARQREGAGDIEGELYIAVKAWLANQWPFKAVAFPGRSIDWNEWRALPSAEP
jgi:hypothetical protein